MKTTRLICDICGGTVDNRRETGFKIKRKWFGVDNTWHKMDVCQDCMRLIITGVTNDNKSKR